MAALLVNLKPLPGILPRPEQQRTCSAKQLANDLACRFVDGGVRDDQGTWLAIGRLSESVAAKVGWFHDPKLVKSDDANTCPVVIWFFPEAQPRPRAWVLSRTPRNWLVIDVGEQASVLLPTGTADELDEQLERLAKPYGVPQTYVGTKEAPLPLPLPLPQAAAPLVPDAAVAAEAPVAKLQPSLKSAKKRPKKATALVAPPSSPAHVPTPLPETALASADESSIAEKKE
jgi:hypothetical protein